MFCLQSLMYKGSVERYTTNVRNSPPVSISFLIGGLNNENLFKKLHIHELMSSRVKMVVSAALRKM